MNTDPTTQALHSALRQNGGISSLGRVKRTLKARGYQDEDIQAAVDRLVRNGTAQLVPIARMEEQFLILP